MSSSSRPATPNRRMTLQGIAAVNRERLLCANEFDAVNVGAGSVGVGHRGHGITGVADGSPGGLRKVE